MTSPPRDAGHIFPGELELQDADIMKAMKELSGYLDITPYDFKKIYRLAFRHAVGRLSREVAAGAIMTREVAAVRVDTPLATVAKLLGERGVSGAPVVDDENRVVGMVSEKDFLKALGGPEAANFMLLLAACLEARGCMAMPFQARQAGDLMSAPAVTVLAGATVQEIATLFTARRINRVVVVDADGRLLGLVTRGDLVRAASTQVSP